MTKGGCNLMAKGIVPVPGVVSFDEESLLESSQNKEHVGLSNTIKSFHYLLQKRMLDRTGGMAERVGQQGNEENEHLVKRWFDLIAEEGKNMRAYSIAMHDIATRFWDSNKGKEGVCGASLVAPSGFKGTEHTCPFWERDSEGMRHSGKHGRNFISELSWYNDRVEYTIHCVADYYLGTCLSSTPADEQLQPDQEQSNGAGFSELNDAKPSFGTADSVLSYVYLPRIAAIAIKEWRRAFYKTNGRQATAREIEAAAYDALAFPEHGGEVRVMSGDVRMSMATESSICQTGSLECRQTRAKKSAKLLAANYFLITRDKMRQLRQSCCDTLRQPPPLQVLDVGSCYSPFRGKSISNGVLHVPLAVTALDLYPFEGSDVIQADWLAVRFYDGRKDDATAEEMVADYEVSCINNEPPAVAPPRKLVRRSEGSDSRKESPMGKPLLVARGQFDAVFFCLMLSFLPHPKLRYRACLHAHLALKDGGLLVIVSTRTQGSRRGCWIDDWIACIEGIGFKRVHKNVMGKIIGMSFRKEEVEGIGDDVEGWVRRMMDCSEAENGLRIIGDDSHQPEVS